MYWQPRIGSRVFGSRVLAAAYWQPRFGSRVLAAAYWQPRIGSRVLAAGQLPLRISCRHQRRIICIPADQSSGIN
jgi:hypothetical protein